MSASDDKNFDWDSLEQHAVEAFVRICKKAGTDSTMVHDGTLAQGAGELLKGIAAIRAQRQAEEERYPATKKSLNIMDKQK